MNYAIRRFSSRQCSGLRLLIAPGTQRVPGTVKQSRAFGDIRSHGMKRIVSLRLLASCALLASACDRPSESLAPSDFQNAFGASLAVAKSGEEMVLSADKVVFRQEMGNAVAGGEPFVTNRAWIERVGKALGQTPLLQSNQCFCIGWNTSFFYREGKQVYSLAAIHGNQLRLGSLDGTADYTVDEKHWKAIADLLKEGGRLIPVVKPAATQ